ncbi:MAG: YdhR family protein [Burkholderiaceae bacterium]|nr:YdhR family protein [Burkholderiaceae bacterium]
MRSNLLTSFLTHHRAAKAVVAGVSLFSALSSAPAGAVDFVASSDAAIPVVAIVRVPKPWYATTALVTKKMQDTIPEYADLPGLIFKAYSFERQSADYGGVYLWSDRQHAEAWFNAAWYERVQRRQGQSSIAGQFDAPMAWFDSLWPAQAPAEKVRVEMVRIFDAPVVIDNTPNGVANDNASGTMTALVEIALPSGISRENLVSKFVDAAPSYKAVPGLLRKYFIISETGTFGGIYLWKDEASAQAWFTQSWKDRVLKTYGKPASVEWFDTPILLSSTNPKNNLHTIANAMTK